MSNAFKGAAQVSVSRVRKALVEYDTQLLSALVKRKDVIQTLKDTPKRYFFGIFSTNAYDWSSDIWGVTNCGLKKAHEIYGLSILTDDEWEFLSMHAYDHYDSSSLKDLVNTMSDSDVLYINPYQCALVNKYGD